jgi:hypothetical protein
MVLVGIIGFRARKTSTSTAGWWGVACAALALALTVAGYSGAFTPTPNFAIEDFSFDATTCPHSLPSDSYGCVLSVTVKNMGNASDSLRASLDLYSQKDGTPTFGERGNPLAECIGSSEVLSPGETGPISCFAVWRPGSVGVTPGSHVYAEWPPWS